MGQPVPVFLFMTKGAAFKIVTAVLLLAWMTVIFVLSAQTAEESDATSDGLTHKVFSAVYPGFKELDEQEQLETIEKVSFPVRKAGHFTAFFILGTLSFLHFCSYSKMSFCLRPVFAWGLSELYAVTDELHQLFVKGRSCELRDMLIDGCGALLAVVLCTAVLKRSKKLGTALEKLRGRKSGN